MITFISYIPSYWIFYFSSIFLTRSSFISDSNRFSLLFSAIFYLVNFFLVFSSYYIVVRFYFFKIFISSWSSSIIIDFWWLSSIAILASKLNFCGPFNGKSYSYSSKSFYPYNITLSVLKKLGYFVFFITEFYWKDFN